MKRERKGFTMSDLERMKASNLAREELQKLTTWPNPYLPSTGALWNAMERQDPIPTDFQRVSITAPFSGGGGSGGGGVGVGGYTFAGVLGGSLPPGVFYDEVVRGDGAIVRRDYYPDPVTMQSWLPEDKPKPEPPQPRGRFQNLDFDV